jgi:glycosyltransferase involved in cell wall biosynthesis
VARSIFFYTDSRELGGAENSLFMLIGALDRDAWRPTLVLDDAEGVEALAERAAGLGVDVRRRPPMPLGLGGARRVPGFAGMLREERPDVVHAFQSWPLAGKYALASAVLARVPAVVASIQLVPEFEPTRPTLLQLRALSRGVGRYIAVSRDIASVLASRFHLPPAKIEVVHNAVEVERFEPPAAPGLRGRLLDGRDGPLVLTLARLDPQKGHDVLLAAAARVPGTVFALAGDGPLRPSLERRAEELGVSDRVLFLGRRADVPELLAACDVFALPSLYEGSSLAVLEAMAAGRPVVASSIGGTDELIEDGGSGLLVPPGDAEALAAALRRLAGDHGLRDSLAAAARERARSMFGSAEMARRIAGVYEELLGGA